MPLERHAASTATALNGLFDSALIDETKASYVRIIYIIKPLYSPTFFFSQRTLWNSQYFFEGVQVDVEKNRTH